MAIYGNNYDYGESPFYKDDGEEIDEDSLFVFFPNWKEPVNLSYKFETILSSTYYKKEQRKSLIARPLKRLNFLLTEDTKASRIWNYLIKMQAYSMYCPLYTESVKITDTGSLIGLTELQCEDLTYFYNLRNYTEVLLLYDIREQVNNEILYMLSATGNTISFTDPIVNNHIGNTSIIYPLFNCFITSKERRDITDKVTEINLELTEINELSYLGTYGGS